MTITTASADALEALALAIFNLNLVPNDPAHAGLGAHFDPTRYTGLKGQDSATDAQLYALLAEVIKTIDGRDMVPGLMLTLNQTNATQCRPKHWYFEGLNEFPPSDLPPCSAAFQYVPPPGGAGLPGDWSSYGFTLATAMCAAFCKLWAQIIRMWLAGNYPSAVTQPSA